MSCSLILFVFAFDEILNEPGWYYMRSYRFEMLKFICQMLNSSFNINKCFVSSVLAILCVTTANKQNKINI